MRLSAAKPIGSIFNPAPPRHQRCRRYPASRANSPFVPPEHRRLGRIGAAGVSQGWLTSAARRNASAETRGMPAMLTNLADRETQSGSLMTR